MTWTLTTLTVKDRDLVISCLRADADRREKAAKESSLLLVTDGEEGRVIPVKAQRGVRDLHESAETLRSLAWDLEHQPEVPAVTVASEVVEEERAATYPPLREVPTVNDLLDGVTERFEAKQAEDLKMSDNLLKATPRRSTRRGVKVVKFRPEDDERAAAMAAHPSSRTPTQEDQ